MLRHYAFDQLNWQTLPRRYGSKSMNGFLPNSNPNPILRGRWPILRSTYEGREGRYGIVDR
eukprot:1346331-Amorphochlora_amoeboformis.AAC.1